MIPARRIRSERPTRLCAVVACLLTLAGARAGAGTAAVRGLPFSRVYSLEDIGYTPHGSRLDFDTFGRVSVIHDGVYSVLNDTVWLNLVDTNESSRVAMAIVVQGAPGRSYYGALASWGVAEFRADGKLHAVPLVPRNPPPWTQSATFEDVIVTKDGVYFASLGGVVFWDATQRECQFFEMAKASRAFRVGDRVFVSSFEHPLQYLDVANRAVRNVPNASLDGSTDNIVERAIELDEHHALVAVMDGRLLTFDGATAAPWPGQARGNLTGRITVLKRLADGKIAVGIFGRGVYILSVEGELYTSLTIPQYFRVSDIASREPGVLWLINEDSIEKVLYNSGITSFGQRLGLPLVWPLVADWNGRIVVASYGVLYGTTSSGPDPTAQFERFQQQPPNGAWSLASWRQHLLVGNEYGLYSVDPNGGFVPLPTVKGMTHLAMVGEGHCYAIGRSEIALFEWNGERWTEPVARIPGVRTPFVVHSANASVWIEMGGDGVARVARKGGQLKLMIVPNQPWATAPFVNVGMVDDIAVLAGARGERRFFDERTEAWGEQPELERLLNRSPEWLLRVRKAADGTLWATHNNGLVRFTPTNGGYEMDSASFDLINDRYPIVRLLPDNEVWVTASRSLFHVEKAAATRRPAAPAPVLVSLVEMNRDVELLTSRSVLPTPLQLDYAQNSLAFRIFSGSYACRRTPTYEFRLKPGEPWSKLDTGSLLRFPGLHEGNYLLEARIAGSPGPALTFPFSILPPWYRTWPAYAGDVSLVLLAVVGAFRWSGLLARKRNRALEQLVRDRTEQLASTMQRLNDEARAAATLAERDRLAGEIHDSVQQGLSGAIFQLDTTLKLPALTADLRTRLNVARNMVSYSRQEVQHAVWELDSPLLDGNDLGGTLRKLMTFVVSGTVTPQVVVSGAPLPLPRATIHHLLRIAQEATTNAIRHAGAREIVLLLEYQPDAVRLEISDDGIGFQPEAVLSQAGHFGLRGIRARAKTLQGTLTVTSAAGEGTTIRVLVPLSPSPRIPSDAEPNRPREDQYPACR